MNLPTGIAFAIPISSASGSEVFVTNADVDWGVEALLARLVTTDTPGQSHLPRPAHVLQ